MSRNIRVISHKKQRVRNTRAISHKKQEVRNTRAISHMKQEVTKPTTAWIGTWCRTKITSWSIWRG